MKKNIIISPLILIFLTVIISACSNVTKPATSKVPSETKNIITVDTPFSLGIGQSAVFQPNGLTVKFTEVKSDSRCASDVTCIWAGEATAHIKVTGITPNIEADLVASNATKDSVQLGVESSTGGYTLKFTDLKPYPNSKRTTTDDEYSATFLLESQR